MASIWFPQLMTELSTVWTSHMVICNLPLNWRQMIKEPIRWLLQESPAMDRFFRCADKRPCSSNHQALHWSRQPEFLCWQDTAPMQIKRKLTLESSQYVVKASLWDNTHRETYTFNHDLRSNVLKGEKKVLRGWWLSGAFFTTDSLSRLWEKWNQSTCLKRKLQINKTSALRQTCHFLCLFRSVTGGTDKSVVKW